MSKKVPLGFAVAAAFIAAALCVAVTVSVCTNSFNRMIRDLPQRTQQYAVLSEIDELIRERYYGEADIDAVLSNMAAGYIQGLNDDQCFYVPASSLEAYRSTVAGSIPGTGISAVYDAGSGCLAVRDVADASPAQEAGVAVNEQIAAVDRTPVTRENSARLINRLFTAVSKTTSVELVKKAADGQEERRVVTLKNGYTARSCTVKTVGSVGYVHFSDFYPDTKAQLDEALEDFTAGGVKLLVLDVRNTVSANYTEAAAVIDRIVPLAGEGTGAIATAKDKNGETVKLFPADSDQLNMSIAVLVNDRTSGAAELLACDLRDFGKAKLFGEKTAGEGAYPELFELDDGGAVLLAVAKVYPYLSDPYDGVGVAPDTEIRMNDAEKNNIPPVHPENDPQFAAAYSFLTGGK